MDLTLYDLTEKDFELLIEGLETIPKAKSTEFLFDSMFDTLLNPRNMNETREETKRRIEEKQNAKRLERKGKDEDIKILQGKLLLIKRQVNQSSIISSKLNEPDGCSVPVDIAKQS